MKPSTQSIVKGKQKGKQLVFHKHCNPLRKAHTVSCSVALEPGTRRTVLQRPDWRPQTTTTLIVDVGSLARALQQVVLLWPQGRLDVKSDH